MASCEQDGDATNVSSCFKDISEQEKDEIFKNRQSKSTQYSTQLWLRMFQEFLDVKNQPKVDKLSDAELCDALHDFYPSIQKKDLFDMKTTTLKAGRAALNRHFKQSRGLDIISDPAFLVANEMFKGVTVRNKQNGLGIVQHKKVIPKQDMEKLEMYFQQVVSTLLDAKNLQEIVMFYILYYFAKRGRENLRTISKGTFETAWDHETGCLFLFQKIDECDKKHKENDTEPSNEGRMYEVPGMLTLIMSVI